MRGTAQSPILRLKSIGRLADWRGLLGFCVLADYMMLLLSQEKLAEEEDSHAAGDNATS